MSNDTMTCTLIERDNTPPPKKKNHKSGKDTKNKFRKWFNIIEISLCKYNYVLFKVLLLFVSRIISDLFVRSAIPVS